MATLQIVRVTPPAGRDPYNAYRMWCPGCDRVHEVWDSHWTFNGDTERPTFEPSILTGRNSGERCHSFVRDGQWQFLSDCVHKLAGQTVPMVDLPDWVTAEPN